jgi:hypothetical protein
MPERRECTDESPHSASQDFLRERVLALRRPCPARDLAKTGAARTGTPDGVDPRIEAVSVGLGLSSERPREGSVPGISPGCPYILEARNFGDRATRSNAPSPTTKNVSVLSASGTEAPGAGTMLSLAPCIKLLPFAET